MNIFKYHAIHRDVLSFALKKSNFFKGVLNITTKYTKIKGYFT